jgi:hypothetical protein
MALRRLLIKQLEQRAAFRPVTCHFLARLSYFDLGFQRVSVVICAFGGLM